MREVVEDFKKRKGINHEIPGFEIYRYITKLKDSDSKFHRFCN